MWRFNMKVSKEDIFSFSPCAAATKELVDRCFHGKDLLTAQDVLALQLEDEYKLWLLLRPELIDTQKLEEIRQEFISMMDQKWLIDLSISCPVYDIIGKVARCFDRPYADTYSSLIKIVEKYIA
jgi:hypothetical protein